MRLATPRERSGLTANTESGSTLSMLGPLASPPGRKRMRLGLSLFWRTFCLLALLLLACIFGWLQTFRALEDEPRAVQTARQIASLVNLTRAALVYSDAIARVSLIKTLADQEGVRILPREPGDRFEPYADDTLDQRSADELVRRLGAGTTIASKVNDGEGGLWIGFSIDSDAYWLQLDPARFSRVGGRTWLIWLSTTVILSLAGAALITGFINRPLKKLSRAASQVRDGQYQANRLDEQVHTHEIRKVNVGFNRMADQLAKIEQDRAIMLAGISHDLRTPLARLRLEAEMSVADADARAHMAADIAQLDGIIDKFLDYARPEHIKLEPVRLLEVAQTCAYPLHDRDDLDITVDIAEDVAVMADEVELARVISNLLENARRYGKTPGENRAHVTLRAQIQQQSVLLKVSDHGPGVAPDLLAELAKPFFRGDVARTAAAGAGLGLSIVAKNVERMGGSFALTSTPGRGFAAHMRLRRAPAQAARKPPAPPAA